MDSISSVAQVCLSIKEEVSGIDEFRVSEVSSRLTLCGAPLLLHRFHSRSFLRNPALCQELHSKMALKH